jgi:hypothetical protein
LGESVPQEAAPELGVPARKLKKRNANDREWESRYLCHHSLKTAQTIEPPLQKITLTTKLHTKQKTWQHGEFLETS